LEAGEGVAACPGRGGNIVQTGVEILVRIEI
jgi:hypothetical protein